MCVCAFSNVCYVRLTPPLSRIVFTGSMLQVNLKSVAAKKENVKTKLFNSTIICRKGCKHHGCSLMSIVLCTVCISSVLHPLLPAFFPPKHSTVDWTMQVRAGADKKELIHNVCHVYRLGAPQLHEEVSAMQRQMSAVRYGMSVDKCSSSQRI